MPQFRVNARDSAESGTHIYDKEDRQGLCPYIVRAPLSMQKIYWDKDQDIVSWKSSAVAPWSAGMDGVPIRLPTPLR